MLRIGTILRGIYRIDCYLSSGGFGNTYVAMNIEFDERVAIKEFFMKGVTQREENQTTISVSNTENINSFMEQREKFKKEARRLRKLKNEHIVSVHDLFEENGTAYYVMDFVEGENLAERLKRTGKPMTEQEVCELLPQILDALKTVHNAGIWHLDLKPANIMVDKNGNVKLIDFGASKQLNAQNGGATTSTAISYTNGYAPREQMEQNYDKFGPWTDIYALGATLYTLLTNKKPPLPTDIDDDISEDKHDALPFPDNVAGLRSLVLKMMMTNRLQRPQSINDVIPLLKSQSAMPEYMTWNPVENGNEDLEESEKTIIANPQIEKTQSELELNAEHSNESLSSKVEVIVDSSERDININRETPKIVKLVGVVVVVLLLIGFAYHGCDNTSKDSSTPSVIYTGSKVVKLKAYETAIGICKYSGPVDENNKPNGEGEAFFNDGRYYKGNFEHGVLTGDDVIFKYDNGDTFIGKFRNNAFYYGKYTQAIDGSYYLGHFNEKGQPSNGHWYDKKGKILE